MNNYIEYRDFEKILKYARIYGLANRRDDILEQCGMLQKRVGKCTSGGKSAVSAEDGRVFGSLCLYAVASAGSGDDEASSDVCRISCEHSGLMTQYQRASVMTVADMMKDTHKRGGCPFSQLYQY